MSLASARLVPPAIVAVSSLESVTGPTALGRATAGLGPMGALTPPEIYSVFFRRGPDLVNANQTIQPFTNRAAFYVLPAGTLTANREVTLGNTGFYTTAGMVTIVNIWRADTTAFTLTIRRADAGILYVDPASPPANRLLQFTCNTSGAWASSALQHMQP